MSNESQWIERAQSAEAQLATYKDQVEPMKERIQQFKANFGIKERSDGRIDIDYEKFAGRLGLDGWLALRAVGDETHKVSGAPGEKPKVKVTAGQAA